MATTTVRRKDKRGRSYQHVMELPAWTATNYRPHPARRPTDAPPGTRARVEIYAARVEAGQEIFHPLDSNVFPDYETHATEA